MAHHTQDDGFHEIQLNGKQLVFLFMAATVVSVVIFLMGVFVGRGVRAERGAGVGDAAFGASSEPLPQAAAATPAPLLAGSDPTKASPPPAVDDLSYFNRLEKASPPPEVLKAPANTVASVAASTPAPASAGPSPAAPGVPKPDAPSTAQTTQPAGEAWAVQLAALNDRKEAEAIVKSLSSKGYAAYVDAPEGRVSVFRVRVGSFKTRREADAVAAKLRKEEQFQPWVTSR